MPPHITPRTRCRCRRSRLATATNRNPPALPRPSPKWRRHTRRPLRNELCPARHCCPSLTHAPSLGPLHAPRRAPPPTLSIPCAYSSAAALLAPSQQAICKLFTLVVACRDTPIRNSVPESHNSGVDSDILKNCYPRVPIGRYAHTLTHTVHPDVDTRRRRSVLPDSILSTLSACGARFGNAPFPPFVHCAHVHRVIHPHCAHMCIYKLGIRKAPMLLFPIITLPYYK